MSSSVWHHSSLQRAGDHNPNTWFLKTILRASSSPPSTTALGFLAPFCTQSQAMSSCYMEQKFPYLNPFIASIVFLMRSIFCCSSSSCNSYISLSVGSILPLLKYCTSGFSGISVCKYRGARLSEPRSASG